MENNTIQYLTLVNDLDWDKWINQVNYELNQYNI